MQNAEKNSTTKSPLHVIAMLIATALGSGFTPKAPGTAGTVVGFGLVLAWDAIVGFHTHFLLFSILLFFAGWWSSLYWSRFNRQTDCQQIVIDEVLGYLVALGAFPHTWGVLITQFVLFRIFDAWKPWPIRRLDRWGKGFPIGPAQAFMVIFDDLLAGAWCWILLAALRPWLGPSLGY